MLVHMTEALNGNRVSVCVFYSHPRHQAEKERERPRELCHQRRTGDCQK